MTKKKCLYSCLVICSVGCLFVFSLFSHQPKELGLFFVNHADNLSKKNSDNKNKIDLVQEKKNDGSLSSVFKIKSLPEFLYFNITKAKPLILQIKNGQGLNYSFQELADKYHNKAAFISIDAEGINDQQSPLLKLLFSIVRLEFGLAQDFKINYPLFLFCEKNFAVLNGENLQFKRKGLKALLPVGKKTGLENLEINIKKALGLLPGGQVGKEGSLLGKIKNWFN